MANILSVQNLSVGYKEKKVASRINFELLEGELVAIVGINGIGKSTLLKTLARLQPPLNGQITIRGQKLETISIQEMAKVLALVLTEPLATKNLTVQELIALGRQPHTNWLSVLRKQDFVKIHEGISQLNIEEIQTKKCFELSDGQLQRVLIARAVVQETPLIFLDEPTTHLDLAHKVQILKLLQELAHDHKRTIVFSTHEIDLAIQLCDKMLILDGKNNPFGQPCKLIEEGVFSNLFSSEMIEFDAETGSFRVKK